MTATLPHPELERATTARGHYQCDDCNRAIGVRGWVRVDAGIVLESLCQYCNHERLHRKGSRKPL